MLGQLQAQVAWSTSAQFSSSGQSQEQLLAGLDSRGASQEGSWGHWAQVSCRSEYAWGREGEKAKGCEDNAQEDATV